MAKVMISLPDELLARVDAEAKLRGSSRSAVLRGYAADALDKRDETLAEAMRRLDAEGPKYGRGGDVVADLRAGREERQAKLDRIAGR
jgi:hypothetical protein